MGLMSYAFRSLTSISYRLLPLVAIATLFATSAARAADADHPVSYYKDVRPLFQAKCHGCHQPAKAMGEYVMTARAGLLTGGESGESAIVPGKPDESNLVLLITPHDGEPEMPQKGDPLSDSEVQLVRHWIAEGAKDDTPSSTREVYSTENPPRYTRPPVITSLDFSPDGQLLAIAGFHEVRLHRSDGSELVARLIGLSERIESVRFSPDGQKLAVTGGLPGRTGEVQIWDVESRELLLSLPITYDTVYGASWSPDGNAVAFGCADNTVRVIDAESGDQLFFQGSHSDWVFDTTFSVQGNHLVSVGRDMTAKLSELKTERFIDNITSITPGALKGGIASVVCHPLRDEVLLGGADGAAKIYQMHRTTDRKIGDDANLLWQFPKLRGRVFSVAFSADARRVVAGSSLDGQGTIGVFGMDPDPEIPDDVREVLHKPTHERSEEEKTELQEHFAEHIETLAEVQVKTGAIYAVAVHPDNKQIAAAGTDGHVYFLDAETGEQTESFLPVQVSDDQVSDDGAGLADSGIDSPERNNEVAGEVAGEVARVVAETEPHLVDVGNDAGPSAAAVASLAAEPSAIEFSRTSQAVQLVVTATLNDGSAVDVTRHVDCHLSADVVRVTPFGRVEPEQDGRGELVLSLGDKSVTIPVTVAHVKEPLYADFIRDVTPVLSRVGCNGGTCHGAQDGKNGFKLSLRGYDPLMDVRSLTDDLSSRRVNTAAPDQSLMLLKSTGAVPHEGSQVIKQGSTYYDIVRSWITHGAKLDPKTPRVRKIEVHPINPVINDVGGQQQMRIVATYADGLTRDVTSEAFIVSGNTEVAAAVHGQPGLIEAIRRGESPVLVRFEGNYVGTTITVMGNREGFVWVEPPANNPIDALVAAKLRRTKTLSSPLCNDYQFVRRVHLDLTGLPPTSDAVRQFVDDQSESRQKRDELIDNLLASEAYIDHWTNKWADLLQVNGRFLGRSGADALRNWIRERIAGNVPYDRFVREILTASGSNKENPAASYYKILRTPQEIMENTTHLFLGTRFNCNKCHDHPFERWTQDQYYELAAFFAHVDRKEDPESKGNVIGQTAVEEGKPLYEIVFEKSEGEVVHERTGVVTPPKFPYELPDEKSEEGSRREQLAAWIISPENPYFATSYVNRIWGYLTGTGLIEPLDDIRAGNPPSNPKLLDWLTEEFIASGFDVRQLVRKICRSRTYQLSIETNEWNVDDTINYSHAKARRLPAEVLYDAIYHATGTLSDFPGVEPGTRASALPDVEIQTPDGFLNNLGRPPRQSACECERSNQLQLGPIMALVSGPTVGKAVSGAENAIARLAAEVDNDRQLIDELFMRILNRPPSENEIESALETAQNMDREHDQLVAALETYEVERARIREELEERRIASLQAAQKDLAAYEVHLGPKLVKREQQRANKIAQLYKELREKEFKSLAGLSEWEVEQQGTSVWTALDPDYFLVNDNLELLPTRNDDSSFTIQGDATGAVKRAVYRIEARTPLSAITGIRLEALADPALPSYGPGLAEDGNFKLTEFEASSRKVPERDAVLFRSWDFAGEHGDRVNGDGENGHWVWNGKLESSVDDGRLRIKIDSDEEGDLVTYVAAPAGAFALDIVAKVSEPLLLQAKWTTAAAPEDVDEDTNSLKMGLVARKGGWHRYRLYFNSNEELAKLILTPRSKEAELLIDSISLLRYESDDYAKVALQNPQADFSQQGREIDKAVDGVNFDTGWSIAPELGLNHVAVFESTEDIAGGDGGWLQIRLSHQTDRPNQIIGKFRVSVTSSPRPLSFGLPNEIAPIVAKESGQRSKRELEKLHVFYLDQDKDLARHRLLIAEVEKPLPPDEGLLSRKAKISHLEEPTPPDIQLERRRRHVQLSTEQLGQRRLTAAQDIAWALINSPAFLYNH